MTNAKSCFNEMVDTANSFSEDNADLKDSYWVVASAVGFIKWLRNEEELSDIRTFRAWRSAFLLTVVNSYTLSAKEQSEVIAQSFNQSIRLVRQYFEEEDSSLSNFRKFSKGFSSNLSPDAAGDVILSLQLFLLIARFNKEPRLETYEKDIKSICLSQLDGEAILKESCQNAEVLFKKCSDIINEELAKDQ